MQGSAERQASEIIGADRTGRQQSDHQAMI
jgi:hypothetical protein